MTLQLHKKTWFSMHFVSCWLNADLAVVMKSLFSHLSSVCFEQHSNAHFSSFPTRRAKVQIDALIKIYGNLWLWWSTDWQGWLYISDNIISQTQFRDIETAIYCLTHSIHDFDSAQCTIIIGKRALIMLSAINMILDPAFQLT